MNNSDRILKKTVFGGFRRAEVLDYVEKLQSENVSLADELRQKSADVSRFEELKSEYERQSAEISQIRAQLDVTSENYNSLQTESDSLKSEIEMLRKENESLRNTVSAKESELTSISNEYAVFRNDKSNSLIQDAMRYSDSLVETAKESAGKTLVRAGDSINAASLDIKTAGERVRTAQVNLDYSLNSVKSSVDKLVEELENAVSGLHTGE